MESSQKRDCDLCRLASWLFLVLYLCFCLSCEFIGCLYIYIYTLLLSFIYIFAEETETLECLNLAWVQDGMTWLVSPPEQSLAMILADNGFDVWISNIRGTRFSRRHVTLDPSTPVFFVPNYP